LPIAPAPAGVYHGCIRRSDNPVVEVTFPVLGLSLPSNNGYPLLGAIARVMNGEYLRPGESLESIGGRGIEKGVIRVTEETRLRIRTFRPADICVGLGC